MGTLLAELTAAEFRLERVVEFAHRHLPLDVAYVSEFRDGEQLYRAVAGDARSFEIVVGEALPAEATFDQLMLAGVIPNVICDTSADPRVAELAVTRDLRVGAYAGVPVRHPDGALYGTLSCAGHDPESGLDQRAVRLLSLLGELIVYDVAKQARFEEIRREILAMVESGGFDMAYQPIFALRDGRCLGLEALARFPEPFGRPDETFAVAHEVGLGSELEKAAATRAGEMIERLAPDQFLAFNASPAAVLSFVRSVTAGQMLPLARMVVEVTEHSAIEAYEVLRSELAPLREQGLRLAVDDAGAGYASLRHVLELRPDFIKLDRWLIDGLASDRGRRVAVSAFVAMARELGSSVLAEGVERAEDLIAARELGIDAAQGYLLGRPSTDAHEITEWCTLGAAYRLRLGSQAGHTADADRTRDATLGSGTAVPTPSGALGRELERLERDRRVSQRLEAVGQLAAGIAHEINTPLQYVGDSVTFLRDVVDELVALTTAYRSALQSDVPIPLEERRQAMREAEADADVEYLYERIPAAFERTVEGIARVRSIVQAMKRFSHASTTDPAPADINEAIQTTLLVCRNEYKYVADVELELGEFPDVVCNIGELNQVFLNLIVNAAQAIEEQHSEDGGRGRITISTSAEDGHVLISIADDGPGIPAAIQDRIYEPFFTTKEVGKGTGQGLALARATVERHAGSLRCTTVPGRGTVFTIRLPLDVAAARPTVAS